MVKLPAEQTDTLRNVRAAAERRRIAGARLAALAVEAVNAGVPAAHVANAAGIGRATLYRWINQTGVEK